MLSSLPRFVRAQIRFLTFRSSPIGADDFGPFLRWALLLTWIAGLGRYWDHHDAAWWQYAGLGSVAYVFVLSLILWAVGLPMKPRAWRYRDVLLFVCMTSPPAILYAIPVERFTEFDTASSINAYFLLVVAVWRVLLLLRHLAVTADLGKGISTTVALLPLAGIVSLLAFLNLEHATFNLMASPDADSRTTNDEAYGIVIMLTVISVYAFIPLLISYVAAVGVRRRHREEALAAAEAGASGAYGRRGE